MAEVVSLGEPSTLKTAEYASLQTAWQAFGASLDRPMPRAAAIAVASPIGGEIIKLTNNPWIIRPALVKERLEVDTFSLINDFGAIGHAVAQVGPDCFQHLCGPDLRRCPIAAPSRFAGRARAWVSRRSCAYGMAIT